MVLVQGSAEVDDENLEANRERYARESVQKLPATAKLTPPRPIRRMLDWYYARIYIHVRPERVYVWPSAERLAEPALYDARLEGTVGAFRGTGALSRRPGGSQAGSRFVPQSGSIRHSG